MLGGYVAEGQGDRGHHVAFLALVIDIGFVPLVEAFFPHLPVEGLAGLEAFLVAAVQVVQIGGPALVLGNGVPFFKNQSAELLDSQLGHQEFDAGAGAIGLFSQACKNSRKGLNRRQQFLLGDEWVKKLGLVRDGPQPSTYVKFKAVFLLSGDHSGRGDGPQVVHRGQAAGLVLAAGEGGFELAAEVLDIGMSQEEIGAGSGIGCNVEGLGAADAGEGTSGDIANRVATGLAGGDTDGGKAAHKIGSVVDVDEVELDVLTRGDVADGIGVFLAEIGKNLHLLGVETAEGDLDALHPRGVPHGVGALGKLATGKVQTLDIGPVAALPVVVTLTVDPAPQRVSMKMISSSLFCFLS